MEAVEYLFVDHFLSACVAALYFLFGAVAVLPMMRFNREGCRQAAEWILRALARLFGPKPGLLRIAFTIFLYNGAVMFLYMSLGVHPLLPKLVAVLTGFVLALCFSLPQEAQGLLGFSSVGPSDWVPAPRLAILCGAATVLIELPCFFYSIAMGITLGQDLIGGNPGYLSGLITRAEVYLIVVLPLLLLSAVCETVAIRGSARAV
ncbi:MAG: stage II sporulation protein M [Deltaproteobacteria bacterium]|nr:stage II sporulation protein M [Deltaproteobacteria bacterium]